MTTRHVVRFLALTTAMLAATGPTALAQTAPPVAAAATLPAKPAVTATLPPNERFTAVATAQASCPGDTVVWSTMAKSKTYHLAGSRYYGKTKHGAYACKKTLTAAGFHAAKS